MEWIIQNVQKEDAQGIISILNPIIKEGKTTVLDKPFSLEEEERFIEGFPKNGVFHVAINPQELKIVGFQNLEPFASYTSAFDHVGVMGTYVDNTYRRQGIASQLFESTFEAAKIKGYEKIFTFVRSDNEIALATYLNYGFQVIGKAKKQAKIKGKYIDEILIEKFL